MKTIQLFQVDTFTDKIFHGARTTVCILNDWLNDELMHIIARENKSLETTFIHRSAQDVHVRCFNANGEIQLVGHAILAIAYLLFNSENHNRNNIKLINHDYGINVFKNQDELCAELPAIKFNKTSYHEVINNFILGEHEVYESDNSYFVILLDSSSLDNISISFNSISKLDKHNIIFSGLASNGIIHASCYGQNIIYPETTINFAAFSVLMKIWSQKLDIQSLHFIHKVKNKELFNCKIDSANRLLRGSCRLYFQGEIFL